MNTHFTVIWALLIRRLQLTAVRRGMLFWSLLEPLVFVVFMVFIRTVLFATRFGSRGMLHLVVGIVVFRMFIKIVGECRTLKSFNTNVMLYRRVTPFDCFVANSLFSLYTFLVVIILATSLASWYWREDIDLHNWHYALLGCVLMAFFSLGLGVFMNAVSVYYPATNGVFTLMLMPLFIGSGTITDVTNMSPLIQSVSEWNPVAIGMQLVRYGFGIFTAEKYLDFWYLAFTGLALMTLGVFIGRHAWKAGMV